MMNYKVRPIPHEIAAEAREKLVSPQYRSLSAAVSVANGYGPCRSCLRVFDQGREERLFFTYNAFEGLSSLPDPGPVFIHKEECEHYSADGFPPDLIELPLLIEAFGDDSRLLFRVPIEPGRIDEQLSEAVADPQVRFVNLRNGEAGCFVARVERSSAA